MSVDRTFSLSLKVYQKHGPKRMMFDAFGEKVSEWIYFSCKLTFDLVRLYRIQRVLSQFFPIHISRLKSYIEIFRAVLYLYVFEKTKMKGSAEICASSVFAGFACSRRAMVSREFLFRSPQAPREYFSHSLETWRIRHKLAHFSFLSKLYELLSFYREIREKINSSLWFYTFDRHHRSCFYNNATHLIANKCSRMFPSPESLEILRMATAYSTAKINLFTFQSFFKYADKIAAQQMMRSIFFRHKVFICVWK